MVGVAFLRIPFFARTTKQTKAVSEAAWYSNNVARNTQIQVQTQQIRLLLVAINDVCNLDRCHQWLCENDISIEEPDITVIGCS